MKSAQAVRSPELVLGLDIGAASIGWALVELGDGRPRALRAAGARVFEAGTEGDITAGRDTSHAAARRAARLRRRMLARRHRLNKLAGLLQQAGLLPPGELESPGAALGYFAALDRDLFSEDARHANPHLLPYSLRARALDSRLGPYELGRAIYHLAHRRGFLSSRRARAGARGDDHEKEEGKVKSAIAGLAKEIEDAGARTLGEYLAGLNPEEERVRNRYLGRKMLEDEFQAIWAAQLPHHPDILTDDLKKRVHRAIFFQRPLKTQRGLVGECDLERGQRRAPMCTLAAQRFRLLQKVNDLEVTGPDGRERPLSAEEHVRLADELENQRSLTFGAVRKLLGLGRGYNFNFETEGEKGLVGNRTAHDLTQVFGDQRWETLGRADRDQVVQEMRSIHNREALKRRAIKLWGLEEEAAQRLAEVPLEDGYCNLSRKALGRILPLMETGEQYAAARKRLRGEEPPPRAVCALPRLDAVLDVRNPAVERALTELRKVLNAIMREHGRPNLIRIELARDLKRPRKDRRRIAAANADNRRAREKARERLEKEFGVPAPRRSDEDKLLLAEECCWRCPYTGKQMSAEALFGDQPQFQVEHIIPLHRSLDDSFVNKTLCDVDENRRKHNRTPWEAYHGTDRWDEIIARVEQFRSRGAGAKLTLFQTEKVQSLDDFTNQQLSDARYASRLAVRYVGLLYGAGATGVDADGTRRVQASRGAVTRFLRDQWELNFLGGGEKTRDDHRQHAIDATVVALTDAGTIKRLSDAAARASQARPRRFAPMDPPWPAFVDEVRAAVDKMVVSHRVSRKVAGALHEETIYSRRYTDDEGREHVRVRKRLEELSAGEVAAIVDPAVRQAVQAKLAELGQNQPARAFKELSAHPALRARDGRATLIHRVRVRTPVTTERLGVGPSAREVKLGSNHHIEIIETADKQGRLRWEGKVVSTLEAMRRLRAGEPVVRRDQGPGKRLLFSLARGEIIELDAEQSKMAESYEMQPRARGLYVLRSVTVKKTGRTSVELCPINDARQMDEIKKAGVWGYADIEPLRNRNCRKVLVTPLGEVRRARD